ncbi:MAG: radical SAM protein [Selenomonas ruminantium]|uniref:Radical SAM protein n=1 Tax=Selenomonas ruminantium TaxID=971 RepID=A0A927ZTL9_SELRU|nr:radical SAM protein [Selenomonas ruminantium]
MDNSKIKPSFDTNRQILGKIYPLATPFNVILDASEACNFRCNYCFRSGSDKNGWGYAKDGKLMGRETFLSAFEQVMKFSEPVRQISLSNHGEPLVNRDVPWMVRYMREQGYRGRISIHTNASLLDEEYAEELARAGLSRIVISLQGLTGDKYKEVCGAEVDFDRLLRAISTVRQFRDAHITEIDVKIADTSLASGEKAEFYSLFEPIADRVFIEKIVPIWKNIGAGEAVATNKFGAKFPPQKCCTLIFHTIVVTPNGDVYPCTQLLCPYRLGNIRENTLKNYWDGDERRDLLRSILVLDAPAMCGGCYIRQNSIYSEQDMIDDYREEILARLGNQS